MNSLEIMQNAYQTCKSNAARLLVGTALFTLMLFVLVISVVLPLLSLFVFTNPVILFIALSVASFFGLISLGLAGAFTGGYIRFVSQAFGITYEEEIKKSKGAIHISKDEKPEFMTIVKYAFSEGLGMALFFYEVALSFLIIFGLPYYVTGSIAALLLAAPFALVFAFLVSLAPYLIVFEKKGVFDAIGKSFELASANFTQLFLLLTTLFVLELVLLVIPVVGPVILFLVYPWMVLSLIGFYKAL